MQFFLRCFHPLIYLETLMDIGKSILFTFVLILVIIGSISYGFIREKQRQIEDSLVEQCPNEIIEDEEEVKDTNEEICDPLPIEEPVKKCLFDKPNFTRSLRELICYCDGSYSSKTRIGYSAFRASDGYNKCRRCPLRYPYSGSTESEVFAAYLALQYTAKYRYDILILYTDNLKVEQLLKRPKIEDHYDYPELFQARQRCFQASKYFRIRVERVRGHTTWYEQQTCLIHREFAKVDRQVRYKRQQHERRFSSPTQFNDYHSMTYFDRSSRSIHSKKFCRSFS